MQRNTEEKLTSNMNCSPPNSPDKIMDSCMKKAQQKFDCFEKEIENVWCSASTGGGASSTLGLDLGTDICSTG